MDNEWLKKVRQENPARYELLRKINNYKRKERLLRNNPEKYQTIQQQHIIQQNGPTVRPKYWVVGRYGISIKEYEALVGAPACPICGKEKRLVLDHDHKTGKVRAGICGSCNTLLGCARDNTAVLQAAIEYLIKHR